MESAEAFLERFALPLVAGGELHVGRPLDAEDLQLLEAELVIEGAASMAIYAARRHRAARIRLYPVALPLDAPALGALVGLHNLLFLNHPDADRWWTRGKTIGRLRAFTAACLEQPPATDEELVARHTLLANLPRLTRTDTQIKYWAGTRTYEGMPAPARLLRWRGLRRVREQQFQINILAQSGEVEDDGPLLQRLLRWSPLTDLLSPWRPAPPFSWGAVTPYLRRPSLCRLVCHRYLEQGLDRVGPPLARAFWRLVDDEAQERRGEALRTVIGLVVYLYAATAMVTEAEALPLALPEDPTSSLLSVLMAGAGCGLLPGEAALADPKIDERIDHWVRTPARQLGERATELALRLEVALAA